MPDLFRFETTFAPYAVETGMPSVDITVSLYCGGVLLDSRSREFAETDFEIQKAITDLTEELSTRLGSALAEILKREGWVI